MHLMCAVLCHFFSFCNESRTTVYVLLSNYSAQCDVSRLLNRQLTVFKTQRVTKTMQNPQDQEEISLLMGMLAGLVSIMAKVRFFYQCSDH